MKFTDVRNSHNEISNTYIKNGNKYKVEKNMHVNRDSVYDKPG